jgi:hypothetical protein
MNTTEQVIHWIESADSITDLDENEFKKIVKRPQKSKPELTRVYFSLLSSVLNQDNEIIPSAYNLLNHMQELFQFTENTISRIYAVFFNRYFQERVETALATLNYTDELKDEINELQYQYKIPEPVAISIIEETANRIALSLVDEFTENGIDKDGYRIINKFVKSLGFDLLTDTNRTINEFYSMWDLIYGTIQMITVDSNIKLNKNESVHLKVNVNKYKIISDKEKYENQGTLFLTNKGIRYISDNKTLYVAYKKVTGHKITSTGIVIYKESGINPIFKFTSDVNVTIFNNILNHLHSTALGE